MRKLILRWLFKTDVPEFIDLLKEVVDQRRAHIDTIKDHIDTLNKRNEDLKQMKKLIQICKNHNIDIDEELRKLSCE